MNIANDVFTAALEHLSSLARWQKRTVVFLIDLFMLLLSVWIAFSLRMSEWILWSDAIAKVIIGATALMVPVFWLTGTYSAIFRYAGRGMLASLLRTFAIYAAGMVTVYLFWSFKGVPRTIGLLQPLVFLFLVVGSRVTFRFLIVDFLSRGRFGGEVRTVLVYGAGTAGQQLANSIKSDPSMRIAGYIDDDVRLNGQKLDGHRVYHSKNLAELIQRALVTDILLAMPNTTRKRRREIVDRLSPLQVNVKTLPRLTDIIGGHISVSDLRPLDIEDLLGREPVRPNEVLLGRTVIGKTVLVTGAGGSIGSEICRQIVQIGARKLVLFDVAEFALYAIEKELQQLLRQAGRTNIEICPVLGSITDDIRLTEVFAAHDIETIYHTAAYKHVPLVEANPFEGFRNNVFGTYLLCKAAHEAGVADLILVSTDKAVRPTNIMGATKRASEQVVQAMHSHFKTVRCSMVRFGNVLGSSGSVVPLFRRQIETGGPITLTHRDVTRYFMTISEAANLVIQAGGMAKGGEVFVLDMGKPMRIYELARTMIGLSGLTVRDSDNPSGDIEIAEVGLRQGEKLYEELLIGDKPEKTAHPRILKAHERHLRWSELSAWLDDSLACRDTEALVAQISSLVPEFNHRRDDSPDLFSNERGTAA